MVPGYAVTVAVTVKDGEERGAADGDVVVAGDPGADLPAEAAVDLDVDEQIAGGLVLGERHHEVRRQRHVGRGEVGRPHRHVVVAHVPGRELRRDGDLLVLVLRVHVQLVVVDAHPVVWVFRGERDLQIESKESVEYKILE